MIDVKTINECPFCEGLLESGLLPGNTIWSEESDNKIFRKNPTVLGGKVKVKVFHIYLAEPTPEPLVAKRCTECGLVLCEDRSLIAIKEEVKR